MPSTKLHKLFLRDVELFRHCSEHFIEDVFKLSESVGYVPGEILREVGRTNKHTWVVVSGSVNIVDGKDTVLRRNDVVGIYSQINDLGVCVYTAYATRQGAICIRISQKLLKAMLKKYPRDKVIIAHNTLKCVNRRPQQHIMVAMEMQVSNRGNQFTEGSSDFKETTKSKDFPELSDFTESINRCSTLENQHILTAMHVYNPENLQLDAVIISERSESIASMNSENSLWPTRARRVMIAG